MDLVDRVGGGLDRGVEPEGRHRAADVVVDRLRNADDRDALLAEQSLRDAQRAVAADGDQRVDLERPERCDKLVGAVALDRGTTGPGCRPAEGIAAIGGPQDGAAEMGDAAHRVRVERDDTILPEQPAVTASDADAFPAAMERSEDGAADDGIEAGRIAAAGGDGDLQRDGGGATCCISRSTSPGSAWRPTAFFEKMRRPSTSTSNTPPEDWTSFTSACGYTLRSSAARPAARGS